MAEPIYINETIKNKYDNSPFRIPLRNKKGIIVEFALVDEDDFEKVNKYKWHLGNGYAQGKIGNKNILLHHFVFKKPDGKNVIDHSNEDKCNDQKLNLREVSKSMNEHNKGKNTDIETSSKYKGVSWDKKQNKWKVNCCFNKKTVNLGVFETEKEGAKIYDIYTFKVVGKNANNNNLVKYEDTLTINIDNLIKQKVSKYNIPKNIDFNKNQFRAKKMYKNLMYRNVYRETIEEAIKDLEEINKKIELIKQAENEEHNKKDITRNSDGIPYIKVKDTEVLIDEEFWHKFNSMSWNINKGYIKNTQEGLMHRIVMNAKDDELVDHINNNKDDNRICNLRIVNAGLNAHNITKKKNASSKYFGVSIKGKKWVSNISCKGEKHYLGTFKEEINAAKAYNKKAIEIYGVNANLNVFES
jgi:hypothetical protein